MLLACYLNLLGYSMFFPFYALYAIHIVHKPQIVGYAWSFNTVVTGLTALLYGRQAYKLQHEHLVVSLALLCFALSSACFLLVHTTWQLFVLLGVNGLVAGIYLPTWKSVYTTTLRKEAVTKGWSWYDGGNMLLTAAGSAIGGTLIGIAGFKGAIIAMALLELTGAVVAARLFLTLNPPVRTLGG